jgi:hypothetical protein
MNILNKEKIYLLLVIIIIFQSLLILHRTDFDFYILKNFYKINIGIKNSLRDYKVLKFSETIKKKKLNDFKFENFQGNELDESFQERLISFIYPIQFSSDSKNLISKEEIKNSKCKKVFEYQKIYLYECN